MPDWLASGGFNEEAEEQQSEEMPDWLRKPEKKEESSAPFQEEGDLPEWLGAAQAPAETQEPFKLDEEDLPDWLGQEPEEELPQETELPLSSAEDSELPAWLRESGTPEQIGQPVSKEQSSVPPFDPNELESSLRMDAEEPLEAETADSSYSEVFLNADALKETISERADNEYDESQSSQDFPPFVGENLGEWFKDLGQIDASSMDEDEGSLPQKAEAGGEGGIFGDREFSSLLSDAGLDEEDIYARQEENGEAVGELEEVDLPDWLRAMRPIEAIAGESMDPLDERKVESAGPPGRAQISTAGRRDHSALSKTPHILDEAAGN